ncbi:MFS transporter [Streptococcus zalophi]|uniref:MFS transporter n=1 Tax=Streptococcus zalophi TaxID=640031 RepID=UPI00215D4523|nr:MFS transporter [Streptococcus zalophi]MCR8967323.1 MFS transporter [Streptococcus zalophi]
MKHFMKIWIGQLISNIGSGMTAFALSVYVYQLTGSVASVSLVTLLAYFPTILLNPLGGVLADRYDRRLLMICGDLFSAFGLLFILINMQVGNTGLWPIIIGVTINAVFVSLLDPAYGATVTDLLTKEEYSRASGLVQIARNVKYLISPALAGLLLTSFDIKLILILDILTIVVTVSIVSMVRKQIANAKPRQEQLSFRRELKEGLAYLLKDKGVRQLVLLMALMCFFIGFIQIALTPMLLAIDSIKTAGLIQTLSAFGMLLSSVVISVIGIKKHYFRLLILSLMFCGLFMSLIGLSTSIIFILSVTLLFFATLPIVNTCADFLIRIQMPNEVQGRIWGLISFLTQIGYVIAYLISGILADKLFEPLMAKNGLLASSLGQVIGTGKGRGLGLMIIVMGVLMLLVALFLSRGKAITSLEKMPQQSMPTSL